jgi:hypothetical protein
MIPLLQPEPGSTAYELGDYFDHLLTLVYTLCDVALGNVTHDDCKSEARQLHAALSRSTLFSRKSLHAAESVLCVTDALADLGLIRYIVNPGLPKRDQANPDLVMLVAQGGRALSEIGMYAEVFEHPAAVDCQFALQISREAHPFLGAKFYTRALWPLPGLYEVNTGMLPGFKLGVLEPWLEEIRRLRLGGLASSYESLLDGMLIHQRNSVEPPESRTVVTNNVTINLGDGASFTGPMAVGQSIQIAYSLAQETKDQELNARLRELVIAVGGLVEGLKAEDQKNDVSAQLRAFVEESKKPAPSKRMLHFTATGLIDAAKGIATFAVPVASAVEAVLKLIGLAL